MTRQPNLKSRVRARMARTGERYAVARAHVVASNGHRPKSADESVLTPAGTVHFPGTDADTTALRILATHADITHPDGTPLSEPLMLVVGGGVGIGVFAFHYAKEDVSSFFLAGRHRWDVPIDFVRDAATRLGASPEVSTATTPAAAARRLRDALERGPVLARVDQVELGTRGIPVEMSGGGYHSIVVYALDDHTAIVGDLWSEPFELTAQVLSAARARIAKERNAVVSLSRTAATDLPTAIRTGLRATVGVFDHPRQRNFSLGALADWSDRLRGSGRDSWSRIFAPGESMFTALAAIYEDVEHRGSGGGLMRPLFATGLQEAAGIAGDDRLAALAERYEALGSAWSSLALAALPADVPAFRKARDLQDAKARLYAERGPAAAGEMASVWLELDALRAGMRDAFPLSASAAADLREDLATRVDAIHADEVAALEELRAIVA